MGIFQGLPDLVKGTIPVKENGLTRTVFAFGTNPEHTTNIPQIIWDFSTNYTFLTVAENLSVVSTNANDTLLGSGARTILIQGLDASYNEIEETVSLDGITPVLTVQQFLRRNRIVVDTSGSAAENIGDITIQGSSVQGFIPSGISRDRSLIYTIPAGYNGLLKQISVSVGPTTRAAGLKYGDLNISVGAPNKPLIVTKLGYIMSNANQNSITNFNGSRTFAEKTDMYVTFTTEKEGTATNGFLEIFLESL